MQRPYKSQLPVGHTLGRKHHFHQIPSLWSERPHCHSWDMGQHLPGCDSVSKAALVCGTVDKLADDTLKEQHGPSDFLFMKVSEPVVQSGGAMWDNSFLKIVIGCGCLGQQKSVVVLLQDLLSKDCISKSVAIWESNSSPGDWNRTCFWGVPVQLSASLCDRATSS